MSVLELRHDRPSGRFSKGRGLSANVSFLSFPPLPSLLLAPFCARSLTLVPRSLLLNRTETLATQRTLNRVPKLTCYISLYNEPLFGGHLYSADTDTKINCIQLISIGKYLYKADTGLN